MKIAIIEQNRDAITAVFDAANGESQVNTVDISTAFLATVSAEFILHDLGIPEAMREGAKAQYIEGEAGQPTTR
ncbi:hypothetical protein ACU8OS_35145 (plasmid) [Rhizobium leguminosarum]